jgi:hypothetical protein
MGLGSRAGKSALDVCQSGPFWGLRLLVVTGSLLGLCAGRTFMGGMLSLPRMPWSHPWMTCRTPTCTATRIGSSICRWIVGVIMLAQ